VQSPLNQKSFKLNSISPNRQEEWLKMLSKMEKDLLVHLIKKELKDFEKDKNIVRHDIILLKGEEEYDGFLKSLIKKLQ